MDKKIIATIVSSIIICSVVTLIVIVTFYIIIGCGWQEGYKCHFIPFLSYIALGISVLGLIVIWALRNYIVSIIFSVFFIILLILFFMVLIPQDAFGIKDSYFVCKLASQEYTNFFGHNTIFLKNCMTHFALNYDDSSYCENLREMDRFTCYSKIVNGPEDDVLCNKINRGSSDYTICYENLANVTKNSAWCDYINKSTYPTDWWVREKTSECIKITQG